MDLETARRQIQALDERILASAAERIELARQVAAIKLARDLPTVDYRQERRVLDRGRGLARGSGMEEEIADEILSTLMAASVTVQEAQRLRSSATGKGMRAVVVGGAGRMGGWMVDFLRAQEFRVSVLDPRSPGGVDRRVEAELRETELVVSAAPPGRTAELYLAWCEKPPSGFVCDMASIKTPLVEPIRALQGRGVRVASFHPMFGPATSVLRGSDVVLCETGDREAEDFVSALFAPTSARVVRIGLDEHDRLMADVLTLAHAATLAFAGARLEGAPRRIELHSTTDRALEGLAATLVRESAEVYFEIQAHNPYSASAVTRLTKALGRLQGLVEARDAEGFAQWMSDAAQRLPATAGP